MKKEVNKIMNFPVILEKEKTGYFVYCPTIDGCVSEGKTYDDAIKNIKEAIELNLDFMKEKGRSVFSSGYQISLTTVTV